MLTTILQLNKRVLVVDYPTKESMDINFSIYLDPRNTLLKIDENSAKLICKGEDLTEEIASEIVDSETFYHYDGEEIYRYKNYSVKYEDDINWASTTDYYDYAEDSFISAIEANGNWWLKNPYDDYKAQTVEHYKEWEKLFEEAESKTFKNPILFEIL